MNVLIYTDRPFLQNLNTGRDSNIHELSCELVKSGMQVFVLSEQANSNIGKLQLIYECLTIINPHEQILNICNENSIDQVLAFVTSSKLAEISDKLPANSSICMRDADRLDLLKIVDAQKFKFFSHHKYIREQIKDRINIVASVLPNPISEERFQTETNRQYVTFVDATEKKGRDIALSIAKAMPDTDFLFCISIKESADTSNKTRALCRDIPNIKVVQNVTNIKEIYSVSKLILAPSQWGSGARVVTEAQFSGIPSVCSTESGFVELVTGAGVVLQKNVNINEWVSTIQMLLNNDHLYKKYSEQALIKAKNYASEQKVFIEDFLTELKNIKPKTNKSVVGTVLNDKKSIEKSLLNISRYQAEQDFVRCVLGWRKLIEEFSKEPSSAWYLGLVYSLFSMRDYDQAFLVLDETRAKFPKDILSLDHTAEVLARKLSEIGYHFSYPAMTKKVATKPKQFPKDFVLPPIEGIGNDYRFIKNRVKIISEQVTKDSEILPCISVVIPVYNRKVEVQFVLSGLCHQSYPKNRFEVIIADDGSQENIKQVVDSFKPLLDISYCRQDDLGYRLAEARNLGIKNSKYHNIVIIDSDAIPSIGLLHSYAPYFLANRAVALFGFRHYISLSGVDYKKFLKDSNIVYQKESISSENDVATSMDTSGKSVDWREAQIKQSDDLLSEALPYRFLVGANCAFTRELFDKAGGYSEDFTNWGFEDQEFGYRLWINGAYFIPLWDAYVYHQEPLEGKNDTDRKLGRSITHDLFVNKCPFIYRKKSTLKPPFEAPLVSIYVPCFNREKYIIEAVESALHQTVDDLEVCVCDDGSTDKSLALLNKYYEKNKRVKILSKINGGIGSASNHAVKAARGCYVGQLDADDVLKLDAVERCLEIMQRDDSLSLIYGTTESIDAESKFMRLGWNWPVFSREVLLTNMIIHHFRFFRRRDWSRTTGFDDSIKNAVDYDMMLKLAEVGNVAHLNRVLYGYRQHSDTTTVQNNGEQTNNTFKVIQGTLDRQDISLKVRWSGNSDKKREVMFEWKA
jgi:chondroitin synthase